MVIQIYMNVHEFCILHDSTDCLGLYMIVQTNNELNCYTHETFAFTGGACPHPRAPLHFLGGRVSPSPPDTPHLSFMRGFAPQTAHTKNTVFGYKTIYVSDFWLRTNYCLQIETGVCSGILVNTNFAS
jgi:hypothetical protein